MSYTSMVFRGNNGSMYGGALYLENSIISGSSHTLMEFINNSVLGFGGALYLFNSTLNFSSHSSMKFTGNVANNKGGAVYVVDLFTFLYCPHVDQYESQCFFQVPQNHSDIQLYFENNNAPVGSDIYGEMIDILYKLNSTCSKSSDVFSNIPYHLCYCNESTNQCVNDIYYNMEFSVYPGETINIPVLAGTSPATVVAYYDGGLESSRPPPLPKPVNASTDFACSIINYTIVAATDSEYVTYSLSVEDCYSSDQKEGDPSFYTHNKEVPSFL